MLLRCCARGTTRTRESEREGPEETFEKEAREAGVVVDLWLSRKVIRLRKGDIVFACRRHAHADRERRVLLALSSAAKRMGEARMFAPSVVEELARVPRVVCCSFTPGLDLFQCIPSMDRERMRSALVGVCDALAFCHRASVVHLDVKPENVVVGHDGSTRLIDFEYAVRVPRGSDAVRLECACGTMGYIAPEVLLKRTAKKSSDVWSLGCLVLACCGAHSYHSGYVSRIERGASIPTRRAFEEYKSFLRRALLYDPERRPSAREVGDALRAIDYTKGEAGGRANDDD